MLAGTAWLLALLVIWFDIRHPNATGSPRRAGCKLGLADAAALLVVVGAYLPLLPLLAIWARLPGFLPSDARTHALVAQHLFDASLWTGWTDRYVGGFPLAVHYPIVGWLMIGLPMRLGVDPAHAVQIACTTALVSTSVIAYLLGRLNRAGVVPSLVGSLVFAWVSPLNPFVGGYESFFMTGLVSQVMVLPPLLCWAGATLGRGSSASATGFAILCFLTHPQVAIAATVLLGLVVVANAQQKVVVRFSIGTMAAGAVAALVYGPAIGHFQLPFGWPANPTWMQLGFGPERLDDWFLDGDLLDYLRAPILTALWLAASTLAIARLRHPAARAVIAGSAGAVLLSTLGPGIATAGRIGQITLTILQPLRAMALIPVAVAATLVVGLELHCDTLDRMVAWLTRWNSERSLRRGDSTTDAPKILRFGSLPRLCALLVFGLPTAVVAYRSRAAVARQWVSEMDAVNLEFPCGARGPARSDWDRLRTTLSKLGTGRLWYDDKDYALPAVCAMTTGFERHSSAPIANARGVGAHVGFLAAVNSRLGPDRPHLGNRAETLGIRYVMVDHVLNGIAGGGFQPLGVYGALHLYARVGGSNLFGTGCIREKWSGKNRELEQALKPMLADDSLLDALMNPAKLIELEIGSGALRHQSFDDECKSESTTLSNATDTVGQHRVTVETATPVDVVLRVTAYPTWHWRIDGQDVSPKLVFPGYYALRVAAGCHRLEVSHRFAAATVIGLLLGIFGPLMIALGSKWLRTRPLA